MKASRPTLIATVAALLGASGTAVAADLPPLRSETRPGFSADVVVTATAGGEASVVVTIAVPRDQLQWLKRPSGYAAAAEFTVVFQPEGKGPDHGDLWENRFTAPDFKSTGQAGEVLLERKSFPVPAGRYEVRVAVKDLYARTQASASDHLTVEDLKKTPLGFTDLEMGFVSDSGAFVPLPSRRYGLNSRMLAARASVHDRRSGPWPRTYSLVRRIRDELGNTLREERGEARIPGPGEAVVFRPDTVDLFIGTYVFELEMERGGTRARERRSFQVDESRPPRGRELERLIVPLSYVAKPGEAEEFRHRTPQQLDEAWRRFWRRRDPTPETTRNEALLDFLKRVEYADRNFKEMGFGWDSDRGRIYIKYGPPGYAETREASSAQGMLIIWTYDRPHRRFVFEDRQGFGHYLLVEGAE